MENQQKKLKKKRKANEKLVKKNSVPKVVFNLFALIKALFKVFCPVDKKKR